jgi:outer membrane PBP1 activator LpoA protein
LTIPVLALNHVPGLNKANLYQFALSPLDDVAELTKRASADGHKRALVLLPDNDLGKRTNTYLSSHWQTFNGTILDTQFYKPGTTDYSATLKRLLKLSTISGTMAGNPATMGYPQAADVLFLSAYSKEGRIINTQLNNMQINNLAVYALPNIYSGVTDSVNDNSLNGVTFCDTPWLFMGAYSGELSMSALHDVWSKYPLTYVRLIAMGLDAYHLAAKLSSLNASVYAGATGNLSLDRSNRIQRNLMCARFSMGQPQLLGFNQSASPAAK